MILKELVDNSIDAAETAGVAPVVEIEWSETITYIDLAVKDNGSGIPDHVVERILDFTTWTSDKAAYRAPMRGAQGNAFKTVVGIPFVLGDHETIIEIDDSGSRHRIAIWIIPAGEAKFQHIREDGPDGGARVAISFMKERQRWEPNEWARRFAALQSARRDKNPKNRSAD